MIGGITGSIDPAKAEEPNWITDNLCSFGELVRIERGPQVVELDCSDENLSDDVTPRRYKKGANDAGGRLIRMDDAINEADEETAKKLRAKRNLAKVHGIGEITASDKMMIVDNRQKFAPFMWKIYQIHNVGEINNKGEVVEVLRFLKVDEVEGKDDAIKRATKIVKEML